MKTSIKIGSFLVSEGGYSNTYVSFWQVIDIKKNMITLREVQTFQQRHDAFQYANYPVKDRFIGEPFRKKITESGIYNINDYSIASLYEGAVGRITIDKY